MLRSPPVYTTGTISGLQGQTGVTGAGTGWIVTDSSGAETSNIAQYDELIVGSNRPILIQAVVDDQHLTLQEPLPFNIPTGSHYTILKNTVSPTTSVLGTLQQILALGTDTSPYAYRTFDDGVSRLRIDIDEQGRIRFKVGATGADGSSGNPFHNAILIDPATGTVSAIGLTSSGAQSSTFNRIYRVVGAIPDSLGIDGDLNFDLINGLLTGPKTAGTWSGVPAFDLAKATKQAADSAAAAAASASAAAASASGLLLDGQCILTVASQTSLILKPLDGGCLVAGGVQQQLPAAGVSISNAGLAASSPYFVYAYRDASNNFAWTLALSQTGYSIDAAGRKSNSNNAGLRLVGGIFTNSSGQFVDSAAFRGCASYFNRRDKNFLTTVSNSTSSSTLTVLTSGNYVWVWGDEALDIEVCGYVTQTTSTGGGYANTTLYVDGAAVPGASVGNFASGFSNLPLSTRYVKFLTEGQHGLLVAGSTSSGNASWNAILTGKTRG